jgi:hypothetical protein
MSEPESTERVKAPKQSWQSSARWTLVAVVGVTVVGGLGFYALFLRGDATPPPPARSVTTTSAVVTTLVPATIAPTTVASSVTTP